ncbi:alpha/beta hydrolase [Sulfurospirillum arcachonense]|uniref:alpha/beta hydrolase n=1 Tax=Sulfurospirillum arcachonense TaxID=57666 RepID=UPI0004683684|nr:alpha/beta hydrolase [Sulfurospirillum arcachonense]
MTNFSKFVGAILVTSLVHLTAGSLKTTDHKNTHVIDVEIKRPQLDVLSNLVYSQPKIYGYENTPLEMNIMIPKGSKKPLPTLLFIPGGAFVSANINKNFQLKVDIAEAGYAVASISYRVVPTAIFPAPLVDAKSAVRFLRANAKRFNIDPDNIAVMGSSAGGLFAAMTGLTGDLKEFDKGDNLDQRSDVKAVVDLFGASDLTKIGYGAPKFIQDLHFDASSPESVLVNGMALVQRTNGGILTNPERAAKTNPINYITKESPPFLVMVGDADRRVAANQSELLHDALLEKGVDSTLYILKGAGHGNLPWEQTDVSNIIVKFLDKNLK